MIGSGFESEFRYSLYFRVVSAILNHCVASNVKKTPKRDEFLKGSLNWLFLPKIGDLLDGTVDYTGRLLKFTPVSFPRAFSGTFPFLQIRSWTVRPCFLF